jgi:hypothetical protein
MAVHFDIFAQLDLSRLTKRPLLLWGDPGIGKTQMPAAWAKDRNFGFRAEVLSRNPSVDIVGMTMPDMEKGEVVQLLTGLFFGDIPEAEGKDGLLILLDEAGSMPEDAQSVILSIVAADANGDRWISGRKIPENGAGEIIKPLQDRCTTIEIDDDMVNGPIYDNWINNVAPDLGISPWIINYHRWTEGRNFYEFNPAFEVHASANPRSWHALSLTLDAAEDLMTEEEDLRTAGLGTVGPIYDEFNGFRKLGSSLPTLTEIIDNPGGAMVPSKPNQLYAIICNIAEGIKKRGTLDIQTSTSVLKYLNELPETFIVYGAELIKESNPEICDNQQYQEFCEKHGDIL